MAVNSTYLTDNLPLDHCTDLSSLERYLMGKCIFPRALIEETSRIVKQLKADPTNQEPRYVVAVDGRTVQIWPPPPSTIPSRTMRTGVYIHWSNYCSIATKNRAPFVIRYSKQQDYRYMCRYVLKAPTANVQRRSASSAAEVLTLMTWVNKLTAHSSSKSLMNKLCVFKGKAQIKNVVCFGLGSLHRYVDKKGRNKHNDEHQNYSEDDSDAERTELALNNSTIQSIIVSNISKYLQALYARDDPSTPTLPISILSYDPSYCQKDVDLLAELQPPIHVVSDPEHFLAINENTLVVSIFVPSFAGHLDIIADMARSNLQPPAAFFINGPHILPRNLKGFVHPCLDVATPRVISLFERYEKTDFSEFRDAKVDMKDADVMGDSSTWLDKMNIYTRDAAA